MAAAIVNGESSKATTVCVTGATGFLASSLVNRLLHIGYTVHATVRDPESEIKVRHLLDISGAEERLKLFRADLSDDGSFDTAIDGCDGVFHVASPVDFAPKDPENDMIKPTVDGTLNVLRACTKAKTVRRVVVTSSIVAAHSNVTVTDEQIQYIDETCWTDVDFFQNTKPPGWAYCVSKTIAEQAALKYGKESGLDVVSINPVKVVGSAITPNVPFAVEIGVSLLSGNNEGIEALKWLQNTYGVLPLVHVEDVTSAQIFLMENLSAQGRHICCPVNTSVPQLAHYLSKRYPQYNVPIQFEDMPDKPKAKFPSTKLMESGFSFKFGIDEIYDDAVEYMKSKGLLNDGVKG